MKDSLQKDNSGKRVIFLQPQEKKISFVIYRPFHSGNPFIGHEVGCQRLTFTNREPVCICFIFRKSLNQSFNKVKFQIPVNMVPLQKVLIVAETSYLALVICLTGETKWRKICDVKHLL